MPEDKSEPNYNSMLYRICQVEGIKLQFLSNNWVKRLEKNEEVHYIAGYKFDLNTQAASLIADDKCATYEALSAARIPAVEHKLLYRFSNQDDYTIGQNSLPYVMECFVRYQQDMVMKPASGTGGKQVFRVTQPEEISPTLMELFYNNATVALAPYYAAKHEYRAVLLDGEVKLSYMKVLLDHPEAWKFNLQQGATAAEIPEDKQAEIEKMARRAVRALGLRFCSVDVIETENKQFLVLEVNSGVMMKKYLEQNPEKYATVSGVYQEAVRKMFG